MEELVSIIITVYNGEKYLEKAINSCLNQTHRHIEIVIIDDGSTDETWSLIQNYNDKKIKSLRNLDNKGQSYSRNRAISTCTGKYIAIMDADDISKENRIEVQLQYLIKNQLSICFSNVEIINEKDAVLNEKRTINNSTLIRAKLLFTCPLTHSTAFWIKEDFIKLGLNYDEYFVYAQDYDLWTRALKMLDFGIVEDNLVQFRFRNNESISKNKVKEQEFFRSVISNREISLLLKSKKFSVRGIFSILTFIRLNAAFKQNYGSDELAVKYFRYTLSNQLSFLPTRLKRFIRKKLIQ